MILDPGLVYWIIDSGSRPDSLQIPLPNSLKILYCNSEVIFLKGSSIIHDIGRKLHIEAPGQMLVYFQKNIFKLHESSIMKCYQIYFNPWSQLTELLNLLFRYEYKLAMVSCLSFLLYVKNLFLEILLMNLFFPSYGLKMDSLNQGND